MYAIRSYYAIYWKFSATPITLNMKTMLNGSRGTPKTIIHTIQNGFLRKMFSLTTPKNGGNWLFRILVRLFALTKRGRNEVRSMPRFPGIMS